MSRDPSQPQLEKIIINGDVKTFQTILIDHPNIVKMRDVHETTLLMEAAYHNNPLIVKCLIDVGSDVNAVDKYKSNAYHYSYDHHDVLKVLINHDVTNINNVNSYNNTPLHLASAYDHIECVKLLLSIPHIDVNIRNINNDKPLQLASCYGHIECVNLLLSITAYDDTRNNTIKHLLQEH
ncbi:ankyrin repeat domain-containing protein 42-like [Hydractinia symbiolongicarpus]|uniref:ankyrin repeat domain-containing protein 42-like n=1 Tax=Hydractinia symbiolongicarpus TaxID=13093 RepID=UPI00254FE14F|nr:ankyrin repeat domain-containing protein 42-like [Hydractinia symbiolongicarpus]